MNINKEYWKYRKEMREKIEQEIYEIIQRNKISWPEWIRAYKKELENMPPVGLYTPWKDMAENHEKKNIYAKIH